MCNAVPLLVHAGYMSSGSGGDGALGASGAGGGMVCLPLPPPLPFGGASAALPFPSDTGPVVQPGFWPLAQPQTWPLSMCGLQLSHPQSPDVQEPVGMSDIADGGSPMFLHPGDMDEDLPSSVPQGFRLGSPQPAAAAPPAGQPPDNPLRRGSWHSAGTLLHPPPDHIASPPPPLPQSRSCSSALQDVDMCGGLSQGSCAEASPDTQQQPLPLSASHLGLAAAAMPPPAPQRRANSMPPHPEHADATPNR